MKKRVFLNPYILFLLLILLMLGGCSKREKENLSLEIWHYYNGTQKIAFDELILEFNETEGLEKGIIIEAFSQGSIGQLEEQIVESLDGKVGANRIPNMITAYSNLAYTLDQRASIVNLEDYITEEELNEYIDSYIEEGRLGEGNKFKVFPTAKATEIMMVNKTDWDKFAAESHVTIEDLETWEGVRRVGELYYNWTDSLTDEENDGKAFFGRDALANYILIGSKQLGKEVFQVKGEEVTVNIDNDIMRKLWDNYYIPYVSGYYKSYGRFSSDDAKIGEIIALVGSTTGAAYFPEDVTIGDDDSYKIELLALPLPNFENTSLDAVQQGAGVTVLKSDKAHEEAAVEFLKWFTEESRNLEFAVGTGYLPVKKEAYSKEKFEKQFKETKKEKLSEKLQITVPLSMEQVRKYKLHSTKAFKEGGKVREILETSLDNKSKLDREKIIELKRQGRSREELIEEFSSDENFENWILEFRNSIMGVVENE